MPVPFLDLKAHHDPIKDEVMKAISDVIDKNAFAGGPYVASFEEAFAEYCQVDHAIGVGSGTESLWLALLAQGIAPGDEVITAPSTFIAARGVCCRRVFPHRRAHGRWSGVYVRIGV